jgi:hypothetical protein
MALILEFLAGGLANALTSALLNPLDIAKTRMQTAASPLPLRSTLLALHAQGGLQAVFLPGMAASVCREMVYSGAKAGLYVPLRTFFSGGGGEGSAAGSASAGGKVAAALCTGTLGSLLANPIDVVKVRLMSDAAAYPSTLGALPSIYRAEGLAGLYRGLLPSTLRGACVSAGELATYDVVKGGLKEALFAGQDGVPLHVAASLVTGCVAACVAAPFDLIKSRAMSSTGSPESMSSVLRQLAREGALPFGLFRGLVPAYLRLGPHALIAFPIFEQLRAAFGLEYL